MTECCCDDIIIEVNEEGIDGVGITSIVLVSTVGITKNYRINLTNGTYFDYSISDGSSIASISKTSSVGPFFYARGRAFFALRVCIDFVTAVI